MILIDRVKQWDAHAMLTETRPRVVEAVAYTDCRGNEVPEERSESLI
jgi:hypothetical protein